MPQPPKPCAHCGNANLLFVPNMQLAVEYASTVFGMAASKTVKGRFWTYTLVICTQCGCTQIFTQNSTDLANWVPGTTVQAVPPR